ncbi:hypothetical protein ABH905_001999 [Pseudomonas frederiksbergensis]|uniref:hypothetical protein n=1 Tax=Pseudomonas frederiksbergensis TaxID=104087 RepID=UPI003D1BC190
MKPSELLEKTRKYLFLFFQKKQQLNSKNSITAKKGLGVIQVGAKEKTVENILGEGELCGTYKSVYFKNYIGSGIQISYSNKEKKIQAIFFLNKPHGYEKFSTAPFITDKHIDWNSTADIIIRAYGKPIRDYIDDNRRRIVFDGIDFRWESDRLVSIGVPSDPFIVANKGIGRVQIGAHQEDIDLELIIGQNGPSLDDVYFKNYTYDGIQIPYTHKDKKAVAIHFYNKASGYKKFSTANVVTEKGIDWSSSVNMVITAYGEPKADHIIGHLRRVVFDGIDFCWEGDRMVRISVPGK